MESLKADLRAFLISHQKGIPLDLLNDSFYEFTGSYILYDRLKYSSLESFLVSISDAVKLVRTIYGVTVYGIASNNQIDLQKMIREQKNTDRIRISLASKSINTMYPFTRPYSDISNNWRRRLPNRRDVDKRNSSYQRMDQRNELYQKRFVRKRMTENIKNESNNFLDKENSNRRFPVSENNYSYDENKKNNHISKDGPKKLPENNEPIMDNNLSNDKNNSSVLSNNSFSSISENKSSISKRNFQPNLNIKKTIFDIDYKSELEKFCEKKNLGEPKYKTPQPTSLVTKTGIEILAYLSNLHIDDKCYITYPTYFDNQSSAENAVAKIALDKLTCSIISSFSKPKEHNNEIIIRNLISLLETENDDCFFDYYIENRYLELYNTNLASNWLEIIKKSKFFLVEKSIIQNNNEIYIISLAMNRQTNGVDTTINNLIHTIDQCKDDCENMTPSPIESVELCEKSAELNKIRKLPEEQKLIGDREWSIMVLNCRKGRIWLRLIDETDDLHDLAPKLRDYYVTMKKGTLIKDVACDEVYAAVIDGYVFRVRTLEIINDQVECLLLDEGIHSKVSKNNLYELIDQFIQVPIQAIEAQIEGFEDIDQDTSQLIDRYFDFKIKEHNNLLSLTAKPISLGPIVVHLYEFLFNNYSIDLNKSLHNFVSTSKSIKSNQIKHF